MVCRSGFVYTDVLMSRSPWMGESDEPPINRSIGGKAIEQAVTTGGLQVLLAAAAGRMRIVPG